MILAQDIITEIKTLPHEYLPEVSNFIALLKTRQAPEHEAKRAARPPFKFGCMAGEFTMADDFNAPLEVMREYME